MKTLIKTYTIETDKNVLTNKYFILDNKRAIAFGWKFAMELEMTSSDSNLVTKLRYFTNEKLNYKSGVIYWTKYTNNN